MRRQTDWRDYSSPAVPKARDIPALWKDFFKKPNRWHALPETVKR
jgi:hypothetical protein